ncbi:MAG TPA: molybdopterin-dependent oxidoreductase [Actinomycetota bacterium]|nr:molybdopterin-dependent oxidoreductase [Actinomycetota bacterium]
MEARRLHTSESFVAGVSAMLLATAVFGLAYLIQASITFPPLGLAQRLLHLVPGPVAVFFIERLGHWALRSFAVGFTVGGIAVGGLAGVVVGRQAAARRGRAAWAAGILLGLAALGGYRTQPGGPSLLLYGVLVGVAVIAYATTLRGALDRLDRDPVPAPARGLGRTRRELLRALAGSGALLAVGFVVGRVTGGLGDQGGRPLVRPVGARLRPAPAPGRETGTAFTSIEGLTPEITLNRLHYTVDESIIDPVVDAQDWELVVDGLVGQPLRLRYADLMAMAAVEQYVTLQCISNYVGGDLVSTAKWTGVALADVLARAGGVSDRAVRVAFHAVGGYTDSLPVATAMARTTLVAYGMNGTSLPRAHGYPARIIAPGIYGMKNVKWLQRVEVVDYDYRGYWQRTDGWDNVATIKTASRIDVPAELAAVRGATTLAGLAWAGDRGIKAVEVSLDGGHTWQRAVLRRELARAAWRQWRLPWQPATSGKVLLKVRAVDGRGQVQTGDEAPPHPSGASGYHQIEVVVDNP